MDQTQRDIERVEAIVQRAEAYVMGGQYDPDEQAEVDEAIHEADRLLNHLGADAGRRRLSENEAEVKRDLMGRLISIPLRYPQGPA